jgi:hypothetical protein
MHRTSEYGIAAHWRYKEDDSARSEGENEVDEALTWFRQVLAWQQDSAEPEEFMEFLRMDLFGGEIFVFTPDGDLKPLPTGATPIDFAYSVHTEVGHQSACQSPLTDPRNSSPRNSSKSPLTEFPSRLNVGAETPSTVAPIDPRPFPSDANPLEFHRTRSPHNACPRPR